MATLIDASVLIAAERGSLDLKRLVSTHEDEILLSSVTASELLHGVHRTSKPEIRKRRQRLVEELLNTFTVVPFDLEIARTHARVWAEMASRGITVGAHDLLIGSTALALTASVATRDLRSFPKIPGLKVLHW